MATQTLPLVTPHSVAMANGTYSYASPPSSWPGTDGTYDGPVCIWCDYIG